MSVRRFLGVIVLALCVGGPIVEAFDQWDHTLLDGNDTEANLVIVALCIGLAFSVVGAAVFALCPSSVRFQTLRPLSNVGTPRRPQWAAAVFGHGPPIAFRV